MMMPSPWNPEAWDYCKNYYRMIRDRYNSDMTMVCSSWLTDSETLFPTELSCYDEHALKAYRDIHGADAMPIAYSPETNEFMRQVFIKVFGELQEIMVENPHREVWTCLHPALAGYYGNGCQNIDNILNQFKRQVPNAVINHLYCTWCQWSGLWPAMNAWGQQFGHVFGGAEYATGVITNTGLAMANGLRGLLIGCCHPFTGFREVEDWMTVNIKEALRIWNQT
jgi:hypothetical protein